MRSCRLAWVDLIMDPLYKAYNLRCAAAQVIRHCKTIGCGLDPETGIGRAYLRDEPFFEDAGAMLARRGFGTLSPARLAGRGNVFTLK